jgi:uncharacterized membrane protein
LRDRSGLRSVDTSLTYFLLLGAVSGIVLRYLSLGRQSLWVDEMLTLVNSHIGASMTISHLFRNLQGPLVSLLMHFWGGIGSSEAFLRLPFAIAGTLTVFGVYLLARYLLDHWTTLHVTFLVSLSPILVWYSQEIRGYAFVLLFTVLMTYFFVKLLSRPTARNLFFYGVFLFAGLVSNLSASFVAFAHFLYLLFSPGKRRLVGKWMVAVFVVLLMFSPWVREIMTRVHPEKLVVSDTGAPVLGGGGSSVGAVGYSFFTYSVGYSLGPSVRDLHTRRNEAVDESMKWIAVAVVVFAIPAAAGILRMLRTKPDLLLLLMLWLIVPIAIASALALRNIRAFVPRYALVCVPAYLMLIGYGLAGITRGRSWVFIVALAGLLGISLYNNFSSRAYVKDEFRDAARLIKANFSDGDLVVGVYATEPLTHYLQGVTDVEVFGADDVASDASKASRCRNLAAQADRIWLSLCREWFVDADGKIKEWFDGHMESVNSYKFAGVQLHLYAKPGG